MVNGIDILYNPEITRYVPSYDGRGKEPVVFRAKLPLALIMGAEGIAVGTATSIPTHNLGEVIDAVKAYMKNDEISTKQLMKYIKGPDFPTGGIVVNKDELLNIYETGAGKIKIRGKVEVEDVKGGKKRLVITEIPYTMIGAGIGKFLNDVCGLVESKKTSDIVDISNQSSKEGIRIVLDLKKGANVEALEKSYAYISDHVRNIKGNYESAAQAYIDAVNTAHRMNESQENMLTTINDSMKHVVHTNEKVDEVIAVMEERQERIENLISHINEINTVIESLQKLESQLNRIANK